MLRAFLRNALVVIIGELDSVDDQAKLRALIVDLDVEEVSLMEFIDDFLQQWDASMLAQLRSVAADAELEQ